MQVQNTNDSSIVSKLSSANKGYFVDEFLNFFVARSQNRSPIINRGYYIRFKAVDEAFQSWFTVAASYKNTQIVSLGAGFDSSYFRYKSINKLPSDSRYIEIDFPAVIHRKLECIKRSKLLNMDFNSALKHNIKDSKIVASTGEYIMLGCDLNDTKSLQEIFNLLEVNYSVPTLFLSECAITYMEVKSSNSLIQWIQSHFPNSALVTYEQIYPDDAFGIVMQNHFIKLGCPLKSVLSYPNEEQQCLRYFNMMFNVKSTTLERLPEACRSFEMKGWSKCVATNMRCFFMNFPIEEKERIKTLEVFDEYEMWHEKCRHYVIIWACQGIVPVPFAFQPKILANTCFNTSDTKVKKLKWKLKQADVLLHRFGHQTVLLSPSYLLISGGFGEHKKKHERLSGINVYDFTYETCSSVSFLDDQSLLGKRMFHTVTKLHNGNIVIIGGRSAPYKANGNVIVLSRNMQSKKEQTIHSMVKTIKSTHEALNNEFIFTVEKCIASPMPTWRHSASVVDVEGIEKIVVFGGCTANQICTDSCYVLNTHTWSWLQISSQEHSPSSRHSHSSVVYEKKTVIITGGLSGDETILNSVHAFDAEKCQWSTLQISGLLPRYSHTSHLWNNYIILVGGVTSLNGFTLGIGIINLITLKAIEISSPIQDPEYPILLCNHCSYLYEDHIVIVGGGGNCFSFGTHINRKTAVIDIKHELSNF